MIGEIIYAADSLRRARWSQRKLQRYQDKKLEYIVNHAYENIEFYRNLWDAHNFHPSEFSGRSDLSKIPIVERDDIQNVDTDKLTASVDKEKLRSTSGSTSGNPLEVWYGSVGWRYSEGVYFRSLVEPGYNPLKDMTYYWHEEFSQEWYNDFFMKKKRIPTEMSEREIFELIKDWKNEYIYIYSSVGFSFAKYLRNNGLEDKFNPKLVITHANILSPGMRKYISDVFDAPVVDQYGTTEYNRMGWQCNQDQGYHLDTDHYYPEFKKWRVGHELIATGFTNYEMPLIRYRMGDVLDIQGSCSCSKNLKTVKGIMGRKQDFLSTEDGLKSPKSAVDALYDLDDLIRFRIVQKGYKIELQYREGSHFSKSSLKEARNRLKNYFGSQYTVSTVEKEVEKSVRGKLLLVDVKERPRS